MGQGASRAQPRRRGVCGARDQALARAAPDSDFAHIAIMNVVDGASNEWLEPVEAEYDARRCIDEAAKSM